MRVHVVVLPVFAFAFDAVGVGKCGLDDDEGGGEADQAHECHEDVGSGDFHVSGLNCMYYSAFLTKSKGWLTGQEGTVIRPGGQVRL